MSTYIEQYADAILSGDIIACDKIKKAYRKILSDLKNPKKYVFDIKKADKPISFIETFCRQSQGCVGAPMSLELYQKAALQAVFGFVDSEGKRKYNELLLIVGRKNGKTTLLAAIALYLAIADGEGAPEIYFIATSLDQSKKGFDEAHKMQQQSPMLSKHIRKRQSDLYIDINFGTIKALASRSNSLDGLNGHGIIIDELAAIKNRDIYDLMKQSMSSRQQPLLVCITTNGFVRECIFDAQYEYAKQALDGSVDNDRFLPLIYELDDRSEWNDPDMWIKANPGLGSIKSTEFLSECVEKAKNDPAFKPTVLVKDFNLKENSSTAWLSWECLENTEKYDFTKMAFRYGIGGFDAADSVDLNSAKVLCMRPNDDKMYIKSMYWMPEEVLDRMTQDGNRRERDVVPYLLWERQGLLRTYPGNKVDKVVMLDWFKELRDVDDLYVYKIGYDPWHIDDSLLKQFKVEFGDTAMVPIRQGAATLSQPLFELKADLTSNKIVYNNNPIDKWCLSNTCVKSDANGNIQPIKGIDTTKRIDGTISLICAYIVLQDNKDDYLAIV